MLVLCATHRTGNWLRWLARFFVRAGAMLVSMPVACGGAWMLATHVGRDWQALTYAFAMLLIGSALSHTQPLIRRQ